MKELTHFIGGKHVKGGSGRHADVYNPATGEVQAHVPLASTAEVDAAVAAATRLRSLAISSVVVFLPRARSTACHRQFPSPASLSGAVWLVINSFIKSPTLGWLVADPCRRAWLLYSTAPTIGGVCPRESS